MRCLFDISLQSAAWRMLLGAAGSLFINSAAVAQAPSAAELISGVVSVRTFINPDARTTENLGRNREGSGVIIDDNGLVLTIGYLMVEAHAAEVTGNDGRTVPATIVGYDHETGFGLLRTMVPLKVRPIALGKSAEMKNGDPVLVASAGDGPLMIPAHVVAVREFAGSWEYLLDQAIFTAPPHPSWGGAALINREGKLVGIGSLVVGDASGRGEGVAGNMFVPTDLLAPILSDLIAAGRVKGVARPWLGIAAEHSDGGLRVNRVTPNGPAAKAGLRKGDVILSVAGTTPKNLADFYRKVWAQGAAGTMVPLEVRRNDEKRQIEVQSINRLDHLKLQSTY